MATFTGTPGNDTLTGTVANDTFVWSAGSDVLAGGGGTNRADYRLFTLAITADFGLTLHAGTVLKAGGIGTDAFTDIQTMLGGVGHDTLLGSASPMNPLFFAINLQGGAGNDTINGRSSTLNLAQYADAASGVTINLDAGTATGDGVGTDTLVNVRRAQGSNFSDTIVGSAFDDHFDHSGEGDSYSGGTGFNLVDYSRGAGFSISVTVTAPAAGLFALAGGTVLKSYGWSDTLTAINAVTGSTGADSFTGAITSHSFLPIAFRGGPGNDTINGQSSEINQVDYATASAAVTVDLEAGTALAGADGTDTLVNVRSIGASDHNDTILGSAANDTLRVGQLGLHLLDGRGGANTIRFVGAEAITIDLGTVAASGGFGGFEGTIVKNAGVDVIRNFTHLGGAGGHDTLRGSMADNTLSGAGGDNLLDGRGGHDTYSLAAWSGALPLTGGAISLGDGVSGSAINAWGGTDTLVSIESARGGHFNDTITGAVNGALVSFISGEGGNDLLLAPAAGTAVTADYATAISGIVLNLTTGQATDDGWFGGFDSLVNIERARGSDFADLIFGNAVGNNITGRAGQDSIYALDGDDTISGDSDADLMYGGNGADRMEGGSGADTLFGEAGNDVLIGGTEGDLLYGGAGIGVLVGSDGNDIVVGGEDQDHLLGDAGLDALYGGGGNDFLYGGAGVDTLYGDAGNDVLFGDAGGDFLFGGAGIGVLLGGDGDDVVAGGDDQDDLLGEAGLDSLYGGGGNDFIYGGAGADALYGDAGNDVVYGGTEGDFIQGGLGADTLFGEDGDDVILGQDDADDIYGGNGNDVLYGQGGHDQIFGGPGNNVLYGDEGDDFLFGDDGADYLLGGTGNDLLRGGGSGAGQMRDTFFHLAGVDGHDTIIDWAPLFDILILRGSQYGRFGGAAALADATFDGANMVFNLGPNSSVTVLNTTRASFLDYYLLTG